MWTTRINHFYIKLSTFTYRRYLRCPRMQNICTIWLILIYKVPTKDRSGSLFALHKKKQSCVTTKYWPYKREPSWPWSYGSWIYNYLCSQCLSPLMLWVRIDIRARCTSLCDKVCHWLATGRWFSPGPLLSSTNKTYRHAIAEILLKVALNTNKQTYW